MALTHRHYNRLFPALAPLPPKPLGERISALVAGAQAARENALDWRQRGEQEAEADAWARAHWYISKARSYRNGA